MAKRKTETAAAAPDPEPAHGPDVDEMERKEITRLKRLYSSLPRKRKALAQGLIEEAARLKVRCDLLWSDIKTNGEVELFTQCPDAEPYERERPSSRTYTAANKAYQTIIRQLNDMLPAELDKPRSTASTFKVD